MKWNSFKSRSRRIIFDFPICMCSHSHVYGWWVSSRELPVREPCLFKSWFLFFRLWNVDTFMSIRWLGPQRDIGIIYRDFSKCKRLNERHRNDNNFPALIWQIQPKNGKYISTNDECVQCKHIYEPLKVMKKYNRAFDTLFLSQLGSEIAGRQEIITQSLFCENVCEPSAREGLSSSFATIIIAVSWARCAGCWLRRAHSRLILFFIY